MIIAVVAGGTGGHFYPGLAVAKELKKKGHEVYFIVREQDYVLTLLQQESMAAKSIAAGGFKRRFAWRHILTVLKLIKGFGQSLFIFFDHRPDAVLAMGGYLSFPAALAARCLRIPVFQHEQNAVPGLANRMLARMSQRIFLSFENTGSQFGDKGLLTGNPVRHEFASLPAAAQARQKFGLSPDKKVLLVFGGSLGAHRLNEWVARALEGMTRLSQSWQILHVTGESDLAFVRDAYRPLPFTTFVTSYCHNMMEAYAAADFIVSRSGASTVSELVVVKKPALLIPYPFATANHQLANAQILERAGCCAVAEEKNLSAETFAQALKSFMEDDGRLAEARSNYSRVQGSPLEAAQRIAEILENFIASGSKSSR